MWHAIVLFTPKISDHLPVYCWKQINFVVRLSFNVIYTCTKTIVYISADESGGYYLHVYLIALWLGKHPLIKVTTMPFLSLKAALLLVRTKNCNLWLCPIFWACTENSFHTLSQSDFSGAALSMHRVMGSLWFTDFHCWTLISQRSWFLVLT